MVDSNVENKLENADAETSQVTNETHDSMARMDAQHSMTADSAYNPPSPTSSKKDRDQGSRERRSGSVLRGNRNRARSTSSSMLVRLTTRSSSFMDPLGGTGGSSHSGDDPNDDTASRKSRQKFKSGVNWNALSPQSEPFMGEDINQERSDEEPLDPELEEMRAVGGTAAAKKWARQSSIGDPIFASYLRASSEAATQAKMQAQQAQAQATALSQGVGSSAAATPPRFHNRLDSSVRSPPAESSSSQNLSSQAVSDDLIAQAAKEVVGQARKAAAEGAGIEESLVSANGAVVNGISQDQEPSKDAVLATEELTAEKPTEEAAPNAAKVAKRKTILGFPTKSKEAKEKKSKDKKKDKDSKSKVASSRNASTVDLGASTGATASSSAEVSAEKRTSGSTQAEVGTVGRRRRYQDTRQLDLLASELAAEALLGSSYAEVNGHLGGGMTPEPRRASMMSVMAMSGATGMSTPSNASHADLSSPHLNGGLSPLTTLPPPQPAFYADSYRNSGSSASSPYSTSPRSGNGELPRFEPTRSSFAKSQHSLSMPNSPFATQQAKLSGLPSDMLVGLGDGPFPTLAPRNTELGSMDPFGIPMANEGPYDVSNSLHNRTNIYHSPNQPRSRGASTSSTPAASNGATTPKRSVLQMSMHNPETELQGLTKPPKNKGSSFGSRGPSRQVTPSPSINALKDATGKEKRPSKETRRSPPPSAFVKPASPVTAIPAHVPNSTTAEKPADAEGENINVIIAPQQQRKEVEEQQQQHQQPLEQKQQGLMAPPSKAEAKDRSSSRKSIFGIRKAKDTASKREPSPAAGPSSQLQSPPQQQSQSLSASSDSVASRPASSLLAAARSNASKSQQSLVKAPSPATSTSILEPNYATAVSAHVPSEPQQLPLTNAAAGPAPIPSPEMVSSPPRSPAPGAQNLGEKGMPVPAEPIPVVKTKSKANQSRPSKPARAPSEEGGKLSKFMAKLAGRSTSAPSLPPPNIRTGNATRQAPPAQPSGTIPNRTTSAADQQSRQVAPIHAQMTSKQFNSGTPVQSFDSQLQQSDASRHPRNFTEKAPSTASSEDVRVETSMIASAYLNSEMSASGFGTRSAYSSSIFPPMPLSATNAMAAIKNNSNVSVKPTLAPISDVSYSGSSNVISTANMLGARVPEDPFGRERVSSEEGMKVRGSSTALGASRVDGAGVSENGSAKSSSARSTDESSASGSSNEGPSIRTPEAEFGLHISSASNGSASEATAAEEILRVSKPPIESSSFKFAPTPQAL